MDVETANNTRVEALLRQMTLDEKIAMLHGDHDPESLGEAGYLPGVPRLGIPPLRLTDGPAGIRVDRPATAMPAPVALAASFSPELAHRYGQVIGRDGRAFGQHVLLSPMVNIVRVPQAGRNFETFGEDPFLAGRMVAEEIGGIQSEGLIATVKHYAANNFEQDRLTVDAVIDERTLREIYLPGFEAAIRAGVGSVMAAYNRVNGTYAAEHRGLLTDILRGEWGFEGFVMSDWFATHSTAPALTAGLDMEMPGVMWEEPQEPFFGAPLKAAVLGGEVPEAVVDEAVRRILGQMARFGLLTETETVPLFAADAEDNSRIALEVARDGAVLLKNDDAALPIGDDDLLSLAVIGQTAKTPMIGGGGSARVMPQRAGSPLDALIRRARPEATIRYAPGLDLDGSPVPATALSAPGEVGASQPGLLRDQVPASPTAPGAPTEPAPKTGATVIDPGIDFTGARALPSDELASGMAWRWTGRLHVETTGDYVLKVHSTGGRASLQLDGENLASTGGFFGANTSLLPTTDGLESAGAPVHLEAGRPYEISVIAGPGPHAHPAPAPLQVRLAWVTPEQRQEWIAQAADAARSARAAIVFAHDEGTEGSDRASLALPGDQDALIEAVASANPRTIVVLNTGSCVLMPWLERAAAVLQMWYPGQEGAEATAALLFGDANPAGKLPVTFPRDPAQMPTAGVERYPGVDGKAHYAEGIFVGYRWYDEQGIEPLFPFGHGLSYTRFGYSNLSVRPGADGGLEVSFEVRNLGTRAGEEVAQVYVGRPDDAPVPMAPKILAGFLRVALAPGEAKTLTIQVGARELSCWSTERQSWVLHAGERPVYVGSSSRDIRLHR